VGRVGGFHHISCNTEPECAHSQATCGLGAPPGSYGNVEFSPPRTTWRRSWVRVRRAERGAAAMRWPH
jgi:hypothetical protein